MAPNPSRRVVPHQGHHRADAGVGEHPPNQPEQQQGVLVRSPPLQTKSVVVMPGLGRDHALESLPSAMWRLTKDHPGAPHPHPRSCRCVRDRRSRRGCRGGRPPGTFGGCWLVGVLLDPGGGGVGCDRGVEVAPDPAFHRDPQRLLAPSSLRPAHRRSARGVPAANPGQGDCDRGSRALAPQALSPRTRALGTRGWAPRRGLARLDS